jgi:hypothetical protein
MNLKFRRFDKGWAWEFVETKTGGWITPDVAIGQIREQHRASAAAKWAEQQKDAYAATANTISLVAMYNVPNPTELINGGTWTKMRGSLAEMFRHRPDMAEEERTARLRVLTSDRQVDAWGSDIETRFNRDSSAVLIVSAGPDKTKGNEDDLKCNNTFTQGFENGRTVWEHHRGWSVPEGLGSAVMNKFFDSRTDRVEYTQVVKP